MFINAAYAPVLFPKRIISLVPSQTELLAYLGFDNETVGITKFCIHPNDWFRKKTRIGGTKSVDIEKLISLRPDLILGNKEENVKDQIEMLSEKFPVYLSDVQTFDDALKMISDIGTLTGKAEAAAALNDKIAAEFDHNIYEAEPLDAAYLIWRDPYMTIGGDSFISAMMEKAGFNNIYKAEKRYPNITMNGLAARRPALVILSSEPYPFKEKHIAELRQYLPGAKIILADGEIFSWYGSRMLQAPKYFRALHDTIRDS